MKMNNESGVWGAMRIIKVKKPIIVLSLAAVAALPLACGQSGDSGTPEGGTTTTPAAGTPMAGTPGARPSGMPPGMPGMPGMPPNMAGGPGGMPGMMGMPGQAAPASGMGAPMPGGATGVAVKRPPPPKILHRKDPFKVDWQKPPLPAYVFQEVQPMRLASANVTLPPPKDTEVREMPYRRVSGIMSGDGVYAILEGAGYEPEIVKPGSRTRDGYRVLSIDAKSVKLQRREGNILLTQIVPLTDVSSTAQPAAFRGGMPGGMQGGLMPGRGQFPGRVNYGGGGRRDEDY